MYFFATDFSENSHNSLEIHPVGAELFREEIGSYFSQFCERVLKNEIGRAYSSCQRKADFAELAKHKK